MGGQSLKKLNVESVCDLKIPHLGIYPREMKKYVRTETRTQKSMEAWFIVAKKEKWPKYPSTY